MPKFTSDQFRDFTVVDVQAIRKTAHLFGDDKKVLRIHDINKAQLFAILALPRAGVSDRNIAVGLSKLNLKFYGTVYSVCRLFDVDPKDVE